MTAAVWARGILADDYRVGAADVEWVQGGLEEPGRIPFEPAQPSGVRLGFAPADRSLAQMLESGEIDALVTARTPSTFKRAGAAVRRLFEDPFDVERDYFRRTGIFPIMHMTGVRRELAERHPWLPAAVLKAFEQAKAAALAKLSDTSATKVTLPFVEEQLKAACELMGREFWAYGVEPNRTTLETFLRHHHAQGLSPRRLKVEELFHPSTYETFKL
jgi:4,5-dihydroxyphthalate decarboxylase